MEEELELSQEYKKGFNDAYRLSESMPQIFNGMGLPEGDGSDYTKGFDAGRREYEIEHQVNRQREDREDGNDPNHDFDMGM